MVVKSKGFPRVYQKKKLFKGISAMNRVSLIYIYIYKPGKLRQKIYMQIG